ncbi:hypothetical protein TD95_005325, partial [Thielaviopsis punctulata]
MYIPISHRTSSGYRPTFCIRNENGDASSEISDADSDLIELENDIEKYNKSVHAFLASQRGLTLPGAAKAGNKPRGALRGPRKAAEPRGDIKARLSRANQAFLSGDYPLARNYIFEIIRINAETHQAWTTLASIFREEGMSDKALMSMVYAAHLRPKDIAGWIKTGRYALDMATDVETALNTARLCYSAALRADAKNVEARMGRAEVCVLQQQYSLAIADYRMILNQTPLNIDVIRKLAEVCLDSPNIQSAAPVAITAYAELIKFETTQIYDTQRIFLWDDLFMYIELLSASHQNEQAISEIKRLSRWLLPGEPDQFWDSWTQDDREFDLTNTRRLQVLHTPEAAVSYSVDPLPIQLRVRLGTSRLSLGDIEEGLMHLECLHPDTPGAHDKIMDFPYLVQIAAEQIYDSGMYEKAAPYYRSLRDIAGITDASISFALGRCYMAQGNLEAAEECFLATIEADEANIEARVELATIYENAKEGEEALILVTEALALRDAQRLEEEGYGTADAPTGTASRARSQNASPRNPKRRKRNPGMIPTRFRPRRLGDPSARRKAEQERVKGLLEKYGEAQVMRERLAQGDHALFSEWMMVTKELIDDFRSSKKFYTWDRYLKLLGKTSGRHDKSREGAKSALDEMAERLTKAILPPDEVPDPAVTTTDDNYLGIPFDSWLDLFLDYAVCLCHDGNYDESANICNAARDSTVFRNSLDFTTRIYLTWGACAAFAGDEEACISISRTMIRYNSYSVDSYRMFAVMSRICQSAASWYNSGPAQKFLLRQIKAMDASVLNGGGSLADQAGAEGDQVKREAPDVNVLMLYGHILFMSTSYTYALHYFMRARSLDPTNPAINLSIGLGYIHYALKRQSVNRQYLILQGLGFFFTYAAQIETHQPALLPQARYNIARIFHLIGLPHLAHAFVDDGIRVDAHSTPRLSAELSDLEVQV